MVTTGVPPRPAAAGSEGVAVGGGLRIFVFALFFVFGGITSLNDVLIPKLKGLFALDNAGVLLVQSAFFAAYFVFSLPASALVVRIGYLRAAVVGLLTMMTGCLLFIPAAGSGVFRAFLGALFVLAAGITIIQVVANPLISMLGSPDSASSRLTFAQAFNSLGTTIFPHFGAILILGTIAAAPVSGTPNALAAYRAEEVAVIVHTYLALAATLALVALAVWLQRRRLDAVRSDTAPPAAFRAFELLKRPRFALGTLGIFLYVGAEVTIGSLMVLYLVQSNTLGASQLDAGKLVAWYWGGAMAGRFIGAGVLKLIAPGKVLAIAAAAAIALLALSAGTVGPPAGYALIAIGLCNSIMFPTIFSLACDGLGRRSADGSGIICMAIVGGAVLPPLAGWVADHATLRAGLAVPAAAYLGIALFGLYALRPVAALDESAIEHSPAVA